MYKLTLKKDFIAQHFLIGGDWGTENIKHSHHYQIEIQLKGKTLDNHGYLVDIVVIKNLLEKMISYYTDRTLNELPEFKDKNPSIENLARISYLMLQKSNFDAGIEAFKVKIWEDQTASASYQEG